VGLRIPFFGPPRPAAQAGEAAPHAESGACWYTVFLRAFERHGAGAARQFVGSAVNEACARLRAYGKPLTAMPSPPSPAMRVQLGAAPGFVLDRGEKGQREVRFLADRMVICDRKAKAETWLVIPRLLLGRRGSEEL
jgi:hypothetical protein